MATTYELIAKNVLGSDTATVTFSGIPSTFTDVKLIASIRSSAAATNDDMAIKFNGSTTGLSYRSLYGTGSAAASASGSVLYIGPATANTGTADSFASFEIYIPNYSGSTNKSYSSTTAEERNTTNSYIFAIAGLWSSTAAITSIEIYSIGASNLKANSTFYLYGITKA
jgi:hypothetical protein